MGISAYHAATRGDERSPLKKREKMPRMTGRVDEERRRAAGRIAELVQLIAHHRKLFLTDQGYSYQVVVAEEP